MSECESGNYAPDNILLELPESQRVVTGRHLCCNCAYQQGIEDAINGWEPNVGEIIKCGHGKIAKLDVIESLHKNQGGPQRHKCAVCAYAIGYGLDEIYTLNEEQSPKHEKENLLVITDTPEITKKSEKKRTFKPRKFSISAHANHAAEIGLAGELLVLRKEKEKLIEAGQQSLANEIIHVSVQLGDGAGYDILSYDENGEKIHIEVKTTLGNSNRAFYISENELDFARNYKDSYKLYRVFNFEINANSADFFILTTEDLLNLNITPINHICEF